jgi:hypothetical protein
MQMNSLVEHYLALGFSTLAVFWVGIEHDLTQRVNFTSGHMCGNVSSLLHVLSSTKKNFHVQVSSSIHQIESKNIWIIIIGSQGRRYMSFTSGELGVSEHIHSGQNSVFETQYKRYRITTKAH